MCQNCCLFFTLKNELLGDIITSNRKKEIHNTFASIDADSRSDWLHLRSHPCKWSAGLLSIRMCQIISDKWEWGHRKEQEKTAKVEYTQSSICDAQKSVLPPTISLWAQIPKRNDTGHRTRRERWLKTAEGRHKLGKCKPYLSRW